MSNRDFSDSIKFEVIKNNLEKHNGEVHCENCDKKLDSMADGHFDHIVSFAKGGQSTLKNCQILCAECNLKKSDKALKDFALEEKAKKFLMGEAYHLDIAINEDVEQGLTKDEFDSIISKFINTKGNIHKADFNREYNMLPSIHYVHKFYNNLSNLKECFGIKDSSSWNRETIKSALNSFVNEKGNIRQQDMTQTNGLPSVACVLHYFPECENLSDIKSIICGLEIQREWTRQSAIEAGKTFISKNGTLKQKDLCSANKLPSANVIYKYFGSLANFQAAIGCDVSYKHELITEEEFAKAVDAFFDSNERVIKNQISFFQKFKYSESAVRRAYGDFNSFCNEYNIIVQNSKKSKYTKQEVDNAIINYLNKGGKIPYARELSQLGLPSISVIMRFYKSWKEPFYMYDKILKMTDTSDHANDFNCNT